MTEPYRLVAACYFSFYCTLFALKIEGLFPGRGFFLLAAWLSVCYFFEIMYWKKFLKQIFMYISLPGGWVVACN